MELLMMELLNRGPCRTHPGTREKDHHGRLTLENVANRSTSQVQEGAFRAKPFHEEKKITPRQLAWSRRSAPPPMELTRQEKQSKENDIDGMTAVESLTER